MGRDGARGRGGASLARALRMIESDPDADVAALARAAGLSPSHFNHFFRTATGLSPRDAIGEARLWRARRVIEETDESITQPALAAGYADGAHMARDFKTWLHAAPPWRFGGGRDVCDDHSLRIATGRDRAASTLPVRNESALTRRWW